MGMIKRTMVWVLVLGMMFIGSNAFAGNGSGNNGNGNGNTSSSGNTNWKCTPDTDLMLQSIGVYDSTGKELKAQTDFLIPGQQYFIYVYPEINPAAPGNGLAKGRDKVNTNLYVYYGLDSANVPDSAWVLAGTVRSKVNILNDAQWEKGLIPITIPANAAGYQIYLKAFVDSAQEICETSESDNTNDWTQTWYPIKGQPDFVQTTIGLTTGALSVTEGDKYDISGKWESKGNTPYAKNFLNGFYHKGPNDQNWKVLETNVSLPMDTIPGTVIMKKTGQYTAAEPGTHQVMFCADHLNTVEELSESNNCFNGTFVVKPKVVSRADLMLVIVKLTEGTSVTRGKYFHPRAYPKNIGTYYPNSSSVVDFKFSGPGTKGQWIKCAERTQTATDYYPLRMFIAQVDDNVCKAPDVPGNYIVRACADAYNQVPEINENNNCFDLAFTVK
jgi:hypothetical protein